MKEMSQLFSTQLIPASDRLDAWRSHASLICGNSRFKFPRQYAFRGMIDRRAVGMLQLTQFSSTPVSFAKYPTVNSNAGDRGCIIITQLQGVREYNQNGNTVLLHSGDSTLIDAGQPWSSTCSDQCSRLYLRLPRWLVQEKLQVTELPVARRISGQAGLGATLFRLGTSLYREAVVLSLEEGVAAIEAYLHILSACIGIRDQPQVAHTPELSNWIESFIDQNLSNAALTPSEIASAAGISVRHLHRLFLRKGLTVTEWIRRKRLENCRSELADPRLLDRNITDIAFSWGFSDSAHFSHCFKRQFGLSPREFRATSRSEFGAAGRNALLVAMKKGTVKVPGAVQSHRVSSMRFYPSPRSHPPLQ
jgi:AraC-like DNA-binding protein